ncbi:MAG: hypothetical protein HYU28_05770 [Actinobacteria bacterium]|nr:hypothetical protein [Actinomycetota bacterium]
MRARRFRGGVAFRGEAGTVTAFVAILAVTFLMGTGLLLDGGARVVARREANDVAAQAARAGAQALDADALRRRSTSLDPGAAEAAVRGVLARKGLSGSVVVDGDTVRVRITRRVSYVLLPLAGVSGSEVVGEAEARTVRGLIRGET